PLVRMKVAMTLDGRIAPPPGTHRKREPYRITGEEAHAAVQMLRWQADAVLTGVDTVLADNPLLTDRSGQRRRRPLLRVVLDSSLRLPLDCKLVSTAQDDLLVFTVCSDPNRIQALRRRGVGVEVLNAEDGLPADRSSLPERAASHVPLNKVLDELGRKGILTLLTETGGRLNTALLAGGFVDRLQLLISPRLMGSGGLPAFGDLASPVEIAGARVERYGTDLGWSALLRDPWPRNDSPVTTG
ncbi:MAG: RibD family protein, partial [Terracidiphilus sp.]